MDSSSSDDEALSTIKRSRKSVSEKFSDGEESDSCSKNQQGGENVNRNSDIEGGSGGEIGTSRSYIKENQEKFIEEKELSSQSESEEDDEGEQNATENKKRKNPSDSNDEQSPIENKHSPSESSDEESRMEKKYLIKQKKPKRGKSDEKQKDGESAKLLRLKKYLKVAGIRIQNYSKVFEGCKSKKSKETKLLELLESKGLKGKPTLEKCKKLYKKIEREREVAELDLGNIIDANGSTSSSRSGRTRTTRNRMKSMEAETKGDAASHKKEHNIFGNLCGVIDSEESENEGSDRETRETLQKKKRIKLIESDEDS